METRIKRTSGIGRIFSLSLNQAISDKEGAACNTDRSARDSACGSPENDKAGDVKSDGRPDRTSVTHSHSRHGSAHRRNIARSSENKGKRLQAVSEGCSDSHKKSHHLTASSSDTKRRIESSSRRTVAQSDRSSGKTPFSSSRVPPVDDRPSVHVHSEAASFVPAASSSSTSEKKDTDPGCMTVQSENATHSKCNPQKSTSAGSQRANGSSTTETGSKAGASKSKGIHDRKESQPKKSRNRFSGESHASSRKNQDSHGKKKTQNDDSGKSGMSSFEAQCSKTEKRQDHHSGSRRAKRLSEQPSGNRSKGSGYQSVHCETLAADNGSQKSSHPSQSSSTRRASSGRGRFKGAGGSKHKDYREADWGEISKAGPSRGNSVNSKSKGNPDGGHTSHATCSHVQEKRPSYRNSKSKVGAYSGRTLSTQQGNNLETSLVSSPALNDKNDWDSKMHIGVKCPEMTTNTQEDTPAVQGKIQTDSKMADSTVTFSNSDVSEVEVWFDVKDDTSKQNSEPDLMQLKDSFVDSVSTKTVSEAEAEYENASESFPAGGNASLPSSGTEKADVYTYSASSDVKNTTSLPDKQTVNIAQLRQANVTTRMRGNHRVNSSICRVMVKEEDLVNNSAEKEGVISKDLMNSQSQMIVPDKNSSNSGGIGGTSGVDNCHRGIEDKVSKEPVPLMSLQPRPTSQILNSESTFAGSEEHDWSSDSCVPHNQHQTTLQKSSVVFERSKVRPKGTVSSSSSSSNTPVSSANSQSQNLSCSSTSYASILSEDFKDPVTHERGLSEKKDGSNWDYSRKTPSLEQSGTHHYVETSKDNASSALHHSVKTAFDPQYQQNKTRGGKRNKSSCSSEGDADRGQLSLLTSEFDAHTFDHTDRISRESSTDTVTEALDTKPPNYDGSDSQASADNLADQMASDDWRFHVSGDRDMQVPNPIQSSEPVPFSDKCDADADGLPNRKYGQAKTENWQPNVGCRQCSEPSRFRKLRAGKRFSQTRSRHRDFDREQITGNNYGQTLESYGNMASESKFSNQGNSSSVLRETGVEAIEIANTKEKLPAKNNKHTQNCEQSCSEESNARVKELQDIDRMVQSASGSECSESVSGVSDYVTAGSNVYLKTNDSVDLRCMAWVKEMEQYPEKIGVGDSESDSNSCPSSVLRYKDRQPHAAEKYCVSGGEDWSNSATCHPPRSLGPFMSGDWVEEGMLTEHKTSHAAHHYCQLPTHPLSGPAQKQKNQGVHQKTGQVMHDAGDSPATSSPVDHKCDVSKTRLPQNHRETNDRRNVADREPANSKARHDTESCKKPVCSGSNLHGEHYHSLCDLSKLRASSSSDCDVDVLSQSDYNDLSAQLKGKTKGDEADKHPPSTDQSFQASGADECWPALYENQPVPCYPPFIHKSHAKSCYPSYYPETDMWVPSHHSYYEQWYNAWMAYSMGCYGYGFQEPDRGMDFKETFDRQNCGCSSPAFYQQRQQHSGPPSRSSSQPPSQPPSSLDNVTCQDPRTPHSVSPIHSEQSDYPQYGDNSDENNGGQNFCGDRSDGQYFHGDRSENNGGQYFHGDRSENNGGQYFHGNRSGDSCGAHDKKSLPFFPVQEALPTQYGQDTIKKESLDAGGRSNAAWINEEKDAKMPMHEESSLCQNRSESRNYAQIDPVDVDPSWRPYPAEELNHTNVSGEHSMSVNGNVFRCHSKMPIVPAPCGLGSRLSPCRGNYGSWPGFSAFRLSPPMMMGAMMPPAFRFCTPPQVYQGFSPSEASTPPSCGGKEERKEMASSCEDYPKNEQLQRYEDFKDGFHPFHIPSMFPRGLSAEWSLRPRHPLLPASAHPPPPPPPPPHPPPPPPNSGQPGAKELDSQTSCSVETTSSEACRLDSSFDTRGDYDASSSEVDETSRGEGANAKRKRTDQTNFGFDKFAAAQKQRYLQMYKDSGSEDLDTSSIPSSKQSATTKLSNDQDENNSSGSGVTPSRPREGSMMRGVLHSLHRRAIPFNNQDRNRRSCPPAVESTLTTANSDQGGQSEKKRPWGSGILTPPAGLSYGQTVSSGAWWNRSKKSDLQLYEEDFPTLAAAASIPQTGASNIASASSSQTCAAEEKDFYSGAEEDASCKGFFRKKLQDQSGGLSRSGKGPMSRYASRLLSDNRLSGGRRWGREAFSETYQTSFIDTHCHLDFLFNREPYKGTYASYREKNKSTFPSNYEGCVAVFCKPKTFANQSKWKPIVEEAGVWMAMGCHPKNASEYTEWTEEGLLKALKHSKTVALGEIGLDYSKKHGLLSAVQKEVFIRQIKIALSMNLPLVIHCREAEDDCLQILEEYVPTDYKIHCHCFTADYSSALKWTSRFSNLYIGLTPLVTFQSAVDTHQVARHLPLDKLLLETDAPYFLPHSFEGEGMSLSHPGMALTVAIRVAELRGIQVEEVLAHVRRNTKGMYGV